jgi:hypothetical protein
MVFHVLNRANGRRTIFASDSDYRAFEKVISRTLEHVDMRILAYCVMPNRWSSHRAYLGHAALPGLECEPILALFHPDRAKARERFRSLVADGLANGSGREFSETAQGTEEQRQTKDRTVHLS